MTVATCSTCALWRQASDNFGICRRYPPVPMLMPDKQGNLDLRMLWSETRPDAWCAEYRAPIGGGNEDYRTEQMAQGNA